MINTGDLSISTLSSNYNYLQKLNWNVFAAINHLGNKFTAFLSPCAIISFLLFFKYPIIVSTESLMSISDLSPELITGFSEYLKRFKRCWVIL